MYVKFIGAGICFVLSLFNILGAMVRVPVKTTAGNSSRPTVRMMQSPGTNLHWLSGGIFFAASIGLIAWAISEYNANIDEGVETKASTRSMSANSIQTPQHPNAQPIHSAQSGGVNSDNLVPFRRPAADGSLPLEQFENALEDDIWSD